MTRFATTLDLSSLTPPPVVIPPDFEAIVAARKADIVERITALDAELAAEVAAILALESEPMTKTQETGAYRETLHYARVNDAALAVMLAFSTGADLDVLGHYYGVERLTLTPADGNTPAVMEKDLQLRRRIQLAPEALSSAGPRDAYVFHALTVSADILDAGVVKLSGGQVQLFIVTRSNNGQPSPELLAAVAKRFRDDETLVPLTDTLSVLAPVFSDYALEIKLTIGNGPDPVTVRAAALASVNAYLQARARISKPVPLSGIVAAAFVKPVERVDILSPATDVVPPPGGFARAMSITITTEVLT